MAEALVMTAPYTMELQHFDADAPGPSELLVRTEYSGVSQGTEVDAYRGRRPELSYPTVTGYQSVGLVEQVGAEVEGYAPGQRVLFTMSRLPSQFPPTWMAGHVSHAVVGTSLSRPVVVPDSVDPVEAALTAMVGVALGGMNLVDVTLGDVVVVVGQGLIGQCSAQLARARGATVVTTELDRLRTELSRAHSADLALSGPDPDVLGALAGLGRADGADLVIESTGRADQFARCVGLMRPEGQVLLQGYYKDPIQIDFHPTHIKKPHIAIACGYAPMAPSLALLERGRVHLRPLVSHLVAPEQAAAAFSDLEAGKPDYLGVVVDWTHQS